VQNKPISCDHVTHVCDESHLTSGVASVSRINKIIGLFCKRALQKRRYSAKETYDFIDPTDRSHPICVLHICDMTHYICVSHVCVHVCRDVCMCDVTCAYATSHVTRAHIHPHQYILYKRDTNSVWKRPIRCVKETYILCERDLYPV